jgi:P-type E1-E2 ATPase
VERLSQHPLAEPTVAAADQRGLSLPPAGDMEIVPGAGIAAKSAKGELLVGNDRLMESRHIDWQGQKATAEAFRADGLAPLLVAGDGQYLGMIVVADPIAPHSRDAVARLQSQGLSVVLLSGDHRAIAERVAREVGIEQVHAEVLPGEKQAVIERLRGAGQVVAMVGDGINDAPALAAADLGIAVGSGSDIAVEAAQIVIVGSDMRAVPRSVALARATLRTIKQNLGWAFVYNVILIPLAAGVLVPIAGIRLPAIAAAAAMALSSVSVVSNSLLLRARSLE